KVLQHVSLALFKKEPTMKLIIAIIRREKRGVVQRALAELGLCKLTFTQALGQGHECGHPLIYRGTTFQEKRIERLKVEVAVQDELLDAAVEAIQQCARTGQVGDGVIMVMPLEAFVNIRTGLSAGGLGERSAPARPLQPCRAAQQQRQPGQRFARAAT